MCKQSRFRPCGRTPGLSTIVPTGCSCRRHAHARHRRGVDRRHRHDVLCGRGRTLADRRGHDAKHRGHVGQHRRYPEPAGGQPWRGHGRHQRDIRTHRCDGAPDLRQFVQHRQATRRMGGADPQVARPAAEHRAVGRRIERRQPGGCGLAGFRRMAAQPQNGGQAFRGGLGAAHG